MMVRMANGPESRIAPANEAGMGLPFALKNSTLRFR